MNDVVISSILMSSKKIATLHFNSLAKTSRVIKEVSLHEERSMSDVVISSIRIGSKIIVTPDYISEPFYSVIPIGRYIREDVL